MTLAKSPCCLLLDFFLTAALFAKTSACTTSVKTVYMHVVVLAVSKTQLGFKNPSIHFLLLIQFGVESVTFQLERRGQPRTGSQSVSGLKRRD